MKSLGRRSGGEKLRENRETSINAYTDQDGGGSDPPPVLVSNLRDKKIVSKVLDKGSDIVIMIVSNQGNP